MTEKKQKAVAVKKQKQDLQWAGASNLLGQPKSEKEATERKVIVLVSKALAISPFGVNILGSLPYINNKGLKEKMTELAPDAQFEYDWVQYGKDDNEKAICKARVVIQAFAVEKGDALPSYIAKPLCGWVIGECSPATTRMSTLKGYQNHLAQTRAENRAMEAAFGTKVRKQLFEGIAAILKAGNTTPQLAEAAQQAASVSAEEMPAPGPRQAAAEGGTYTKAINAIIAEKDPAKLRDFKKKIEGSKIYTDEQKAQLLGFIDDRLQHGNQKEVA